MELREEGEVEMERWTRPRAYIVHMSALQTKELHRVVMGRVEERYRAYVASMKGPTPDSTADG